MSGLPAGWKEISLDVIGRLHFGQSPASATVNLTGQGTLYVTGPEQWDGTRLHQGKWTTSPQKVVPDGCIFITVKGAGVGKLFPGIACAIGRDVYAFESAKGVDRDFVRLALKHNIQEIVRSARGDIPGLSRNDILGHEVRLPPLPEQRRIVAKLDALDARAKRARADLDRIPALVARAKQAILAKAYDGTLTADRRGKAEGNVKNCHLSDLIASPVRNGLSVKGSDAPPGIRALKLSALRGQIINLADVRYLDIDSNDASRFYLEEQDILISRGNGTLRYVGTASLVRGLIEPTIFPDTAFRIRLNPEKALPQWLCLIWNAPQTRSQIEAAAKTTAGIFKISQGDLQTVDILVPSVVAQQEIVRRIESAFAKIDRIASDAASASKLLTRLDQAILTKAFCGELVPQNPEDEPAEKLLERIKAASPAEHGSARGRKGKRKAKTGATA